MSAPNTQPAGAGGEVTPLPLAGERFTGTDDDRRDGHRSTARAIGTDPGLHAGRRRPCGRRRHAALHDAPLPRWKRAEVLDRAARLLAEREEDFARIIAAEAAKPIRTARAEAQRAVGTFQFAAAEARTFDGEMVPLDAIAAGEGKIGFAMRVPDRRRRCDLAVQLPAQPRRPQARARRSPPAARWC